MIEHSTPTKAPLMLDDRSLLDWLRRLRQYAQKIPFAAADAAQQKDGKTWADVLFPAQGLDEAALAGLYDARQAPDGKMLPHQAMMLAFFRMLETPRALLNAMPQRHRQLYYRDLLGLSERAAEPDRAVVCFVPDKDRYELRIPAGTLLAGGRDSAGQALQYRLDGDVLANAGRVVRIGFAAPGETTLEVVFDADAGISPGAQGARLFVAAPAASAPAAFPEVPAAPQHALLLYLDGLQPGQDIDLYWNLRSPMPQAPQWQYLDQEGQMPELALTDGTGGLFDSGRWHAVLPEDAYIDAGSGQCLLRALVAPQTDPDGAATTPTLYAIYSNAGIAVLDDPGLVDAGHLAAGLPAGHIRRPVTPMDGLARVEQPMPSRGGRPRESEESFLQRTAQRLSHRNRAITWRDISQLLQDQFPEIAQLRVPDVEQRLDATGIQEVVVMPQPDQRDNEDPLRPLFGAARLERMRAFIAERSSAWLRLKFINGQYRDVKVQCQPVFMDGVNPAYGRRRIAEAVSRHFMPWTQAGGAMASLGGTLDYFEMAAIIQQQPEVSYVATLTMDGGQAAIVAAADEVLIVTLEMTDATELPPDDAAGARRKPRAAKPRRSTGKGTTT